MQLLLQTAMSCKWVKEKEGRLGQQNNNWVEDCLIHWVLSSESLRYNPNHSSMYIGTQCYGLLNVLCSTDWHCWTKTRACACSSGHDPSIGAGCNWTNPNMVELLGQKHPPCKPKKQIVKSKIFYCLPSKPANIT